MGDDCREVEGHGPQGLLHQVEGNLFLLPQEPTNSSFLVDFILSQNQTPSSLHLSIQRRLLQHLVMVRGIGEAAKHSGDGAGLGDLVVEDSVMIVEGEEEAERVELRRSRGRREGGDEGLS